MPLPPSSPAPARLSSLERSARRLLEEEREWDAASARGVLLAELAVLLDQLTQTRRVYERLEADLAFVAAEVGSEVLQVEMIYGRSSPLRTSLLGRLASLQTEQRRLVVQREQDLRGLLMQVGPLVAKLGFLAGADAD